MISVIEFTTSNLERTQNYVIQVAKPFVEMNGYITKARVICGNSAPLRSPGDTDAHHFSITAPCLTVTLTPKETDVWLLRCKISQGVDGLDFAWRLLETHGRLHVERIDFHFLSDDIGRALAHSHALPRPQNMTFDEALLVVNLLRGQSQHANTVEQALRVTLASLEHTLNADDEGVLAYVMLEELTQRAMAKIGRTTVANEG